MKQNILVIGGTGKTGRRVVKHLEKTACATTRTLKVQRHSPSAASVNFASDHEIVAAVPVAGVEKVRCVSGAAKLRDKRVVITSSVANLQD